LKARGDIGVSTLVYIIKEFELCISLLTDHMSWIFYLVIRNTLIMHCEEFKNSTESVVMPL
jgi:hypothetical protein